jgi:hypothetical protein
MNPALFRSSLGVAVVLAIAASRGADVKSHGAKGDGQADDTAAIQHAVDAGGGVTFPTGTYRLTRTVTINLDQTGFVALTADGTARVVMAGAGPAFAFIGTHAGSAAPDQFKPNVWERQRTPRIDGLEIVGAHADADGIAANGTMQITIQSVVVREARHAIRLHGLNRNVLINACHLYHNRGVGVFYDNVNLHQTNISASHISYNAGGGVVLRGGNVRNVHIGTCDIESNMAANTPATANVLIDCTGGSVGEVAITGCTLQHNPAGPNSANIRMIGAGVQSEANRAPTQEGHVTISGNVLSDVQVNIHLRNARGVTLTGNTFWMGVQHDLLVEDSSNVVVGANNFDRNPRYEMGRNSARGGVVFRRSRDCTVSGIHVNGVRHHGAAVLLDGCSRINFSNASILDSDGTGLEVRESSLMRVSGCLIRDDRAEPNAAPAILVAAGANNMIVGNTLDRAARVEGTSATSRDNEVITRRAPK